MPDYKELGEGEVNLEPNTEEGVPEKRLERKQEPRPRLIENLSPSRYKETRR